MVDMVGRTVRGYEIHEKIGEGGYGVVYRASELSINRDVAIKKILPQFAGESEFIKRFETEARLVAQLEDPHIVPLYSYWQDDEGAFLVMRYVSGGSLRERLRKYGGLSIAETMRILDQVAEALSVAHQADVIHRDLKPDNILIDPRGNAYLTDFGIARQLHDDAHITGPDAIVGTFAYLAPEQLQSQPLSAGTDIYALGLLLYEMLTGTHPFFDTPPVMMVMKHLQESLPPIHVGRPNLANGVDDIIQKATAKNVADRYSSTLDVAAAFRSIYTVRNALENIPVIFPSARQTVTINPPRKLHKTVEGRNRNNMLQNVRKFWIEGVLNSSLYGATLIEMGMKQEADHIELAWDTLLRTPTVMDVVIPEDTNILNIFDQLSGKLLILGDPGGGKTTTLLELAKSLLLRAEDDDAHAIPVVFNLSSWSENGKPLTEWLIDELNSKYQAPKKVAQQWVEDDALLILLDGLDEVTADLREACVQSINQYRAEHGFVDIVVCSRTNDYDVLTNRLKLNGAIVIQSLNDKQVDTYLASLGSEMETLRRMLTNDNILWELGRSPLMLNIMALAYRGVSSQELLQFNTPEAQRKHIFEIYVRRMFERRAVEKLFTHEETLTYLSWLACRMRENTQSIFQLEKMQPEWMNSKQVQSYYFRFLAIMFLFTVLFNGIGYLFIAETLGFNLWLFGVLLMIAIPLQTWIIVTDRYRYKIWTLIAGISLGFAMGLAASATKGLSGGAVVASFATIIMVVNTYISGHSVGKMGIDLNHIVPIEKLSFSREKIDIWLGGVGFIQTAFMVVLFLLILQAETTILKTILGIVVAGTVVGILAVYQSGLTASEVNVHVLPNQGIKDSLQNGLTSALIFGMTYLMVGLFGIAPNTSLGTGLFLGLGTSIITAVSYGLIYGGRIVLQHIALRWALTVDGSIPRYYVRFLEYATKLIFLRKVGGGYIFVHRYLLEYFSSME